MSNVTRAGFGPVLLARSLAAENNQRLVLADFQTDRTRGRPHRRSLARDHASPSSNYTLGFTLLAEPPLIISCGGAARRQFKNTPYSIFGRRGTRITVPPDIGSLTL